MSLETKEQILYLLITIICWCSAARLFWKWDIGRHRSKFEQRVKKGKKPAVNESERKA
jgi:hypothetical protein